MICENIDNPIINFIDVYNYNKIVDSLLSCSKEEIKNLLMQ